MAGRLDPSGDPASLRLARSVMSEFSFTQSIALVFLTGGIGALARYAVLVVSAHAAGPFPAGSLVVNALAAFIGSALVAARVPDELLLIIGGGFVGSLGTLSSLCSEIIAMERLGKYGSIVLFVVLTLVTGIAATLSGNAAGASFHV